MQSFPWVYHCSKELQELQNFTAVRDGKEWTPGGQLAGSATTDLGAPTFQAGRNGLSHLSRKGRSPRYSSRDWGKTGVVLCQGLLCAVENEASRRGEGREGVAAQFSRSSWIPYPQGVEAQMSPGLSLLSP